MKEKKNSEEKKILLQKDSNVKKTINVKDTILALKNNDNFIIVLEIIIILALVVALVFIIGGQKNTDDKNQSYTYMDSVSNYFNTYIKIIGYEKNQDEFTEVGQEAADLIGEYHRLFDIYNDYYTCPKCDKLVGF